MRRAGRFSRIIVVTSAAYSVAAVISFVLFFGPFDQGRIGWAALFLVCVCLPYVPLYLAAHFRRDRPSTFIAIVVTLCAFLAAIGYSLSFGPNDGEYAIVYYAVPIIQLPLAVIALTIALWPAVQRNS